MTAANEMDPAEHGWLEAFFGESNELRWQALSDGSARADWSAQVLPWLRLLRGEGANGPVVLPVFEAGLVNTWYGLAPSGRWLNQLAEELLAWIGPTYSDFSGALHELSESDPMQRAMRDRFGPLAVRFSARSDADRSAIQALLRLYHATLLRRPAVADRGQRPFGRVRGDFDRALLAGNEGSARARLDEMVGSGRVSAEQRKCLDIRLLAGLGKFERLARDHGLLHSIVDIPLPPQTLLDVVDSLYRTYVSPIETADFETVRRTFSQYIGRPYGPLFRERKGLRQPKVLTAFLLNESCATVPDLTRGESLFRAYPDDAAERQLGQAILEFIRGLSKAPTNDSHAMARQAMVDEDYLAAFDLCVGAFPDPWAVRSLLRCAEELGTAEHASIAVSLLRDAPKSAMGALGPQDLQRLERLSGPPSVEAQDRPEAGWLAWAKHVVSDVAGSPDSMLILERAVTGWSPLEYARDPQVCDQLAAVLLDARGAAEEAFRNAFPQLVAFFVEGQPAPTRGFSSVYLALIKIIAWGGIASADELRLAASILEALVEVAPAKSVYEEALDDILEIAKANRAPSTVDWALEVSELLILNPSPAPESRLRFFMESLSMVQAWAHRLSSSQRAVFAMLARDYGCPEVTGGLPETPKLDDETEGAGDALRGFTGLVGIYTLSEAAGRRARELLGLLLPLARVELNSDLVATDRLEGLARSADIFAFAWRKSSHPAFYCAKAARGDRELAMPAGGGAASIVRTVLQCLQGN